MPGRSSAPRNTIASSRGRSGQSCIFELPGKTKGRLAPARLPCRSTGTALKEVARSEKDPGGAGGLRFRDLSVGPGREATMLMIRVFWAWQRLKLGGTVIHVAQCYTSCGAR